MSPSPKSRAPVFQPPHKLLSPTASKLSYAEDDLPTLDDIISSLRASGFRLTPQREAILQIFYYLPEGKHLSAEELFQQVQADDAEISLATAYRTLKLLASVGVLRELDFAEDHKHYELVRNPEAPHHHIICVSCGGTDEFESPEALQLAATLAASQNFKLIDVQLKLFGLCQNCQDAGEQLPPMLGRK